MNVKTLQDVIREYNSHEEEIFDNATDIFISKVRDEFEKMYRNHEWSKMIGFQRPERASFISTYVLEQIEELS